MLKRLRQANKARWAEWAKKPMCPSDLPFQAIELGGECGEVLNAIKKLLRSRRGMIGGVHVIGGVHAIAEELADVLICVDLIAANLGIDLEAATIAKFDATSAKHGLGTGLGGGDNNNNKIDN